MPDDADVKYEEHAGAEKPKKLADDKMVEVRTLGSDERVSVFQAKASDVNWSTVTKYRLVGTGK